jgi:uncharacterized membrane protein YbhN (UPF0104 family)
VDRTETVETTWQPSRPATKTRRALPWLPAAGGAVVLGIVLWRVGTGPFVAGLRVVGPWTVLAALAAGLASTLSCAWRWRRIAARLGVDLPVLTSVAAYYRSQFLNVTLPIGVAGDVHRAVRHGRQLGDVGRGAWAVVLDRASGLVAQVCLAAAALLVLPSPLPATTAAVAAAVAALVALVVLAGIVLARGLGVVVLVASGGVLAANVALFVVAARAAGTRASLPSLVGLTLLALLAAVLPLNLAGWGPREGVAAWAFAAAGLGANGGLTAAVAYGALSFVACLPGAAVLVAQSLRPRGRWTA